MFYILDNKFGLTFEDIRRAFPHISIPYGADVSHLGAQAYAPTVPPVAAWNERVVEVMPQGGLQQWQVVALAGNDLAQAKASRLSQLTGSVQRKLDMCAAERGYDNILSACSYVSSTVTKFASEGKACLDWRDAVWSKYHGILAEIEAGTRAIPTEAELLAELPVMTWPV